MKIKFLLLSLLIGIFFCSCGNKIENVVSTGENSFSCTIAGRERSFIYVEPENKNDDTKLVVLLHGAEDSAENFQKTICFEEEAFKRNYAVLYLQGDVNPEVKSSTIGWVNTYTKAGNEDIDFVVETAEYIKKTYNVGKKTYVAGFSQGAFLTMKLAVEKADKFDGFASVAGIMVKHVWEKRKNKPSAFFQINGLKDELIPMDLNKSSQYSPNPSMEKVLEYFSKTNKLGTDYTQENINKKVTLTKNGNKVWWMVIQDYHHGWPKNDRAEINVNEYILDFFEKN